MLISSVVSLFNLLSKAPVWLEIGAGQTGYSRAKLVIPQPESTAEAGELPAD